MKRTWALDARAATEERAGQPPPFLRPPSQPVESVFSTTHGERPSFKGAGRRI